MSSTKPPLMDEEAVWLEEWLSPEDYPAPEFEIGQTGCCEQHAVAERMFGWWVMGGIGALFGVGKTGWGYRLKDGSPGSGQLYWANGVRDNWMVCNVMGLSQ